MTNPARRLPLLLLLTGLPLLGCGDDTAGAGDDDDDAIEPTFTSIYDRILGDDLRCRRCHDSTETDEVLVTFYEESGELDFATPTIAYDMLLNQPAAGDECAGLGTLLVPGDPDSSLVLDKVLEDPICGDQMPLLASDLILTTAERDALRTWIGNGALMN